MGENLQGEVISSAADVVISLVFRRASYSDLPSFGEERSPGVRMDAWKVVRCCDTMIYPDVDTPYLTQFTCSVCGKVETWGTTKQRVMLVLYKKANEHLPTTGS